MNQRYEWGDVLHLIGLQMTYHMPLDIVRQSLILGFQLLRTTLAKDPLSCIVCLTNGLCGVGLRYGYKRYILWNRGENILDSVGNSHILAVLLTQK